MTTDPQREHLAEVVSTQIVSFAARRQTNKKKAFWFKMLITSFSAGTTILLGLQGLETLFPSAPTVIKNMALVLSAFVTLFSAWDTFFNHKALWVRYTKTVTDLRSILSELEFLSSNTDSKVEGTDLDRLFRKYQSVLDETNSFWQNLRDDR
jgi:hypothetical protein